MDVKAQVERITKDLLAVLQVLVKSGTSEGGSALWNRAGKQRSGPSPQPRGDASLAASAPADACSSGGAGGCLCVAVLCSV